METPALDKSETEEYGRPAIIFAAVALPTPFSAIKSASDAVFRSTGPELAGAASAFADFFGVIAVEESGAALLLEEAPPPEPTVTSGVILVMVALETPALDKSATDE